MAAGERAATGEKQAPDSTTAERGAKKPPDHTAVAGDEYEGERAPRSRSNEDLTRGQSVAKAETKFLFVEITDVGGKPIGEFDEVVHDGVVTDRFVEDKSAKGLAHPKNRQTPEQWAQKQIFEKTDVRIRNLEGASVSRARPDGLGSPTVPSVDDLKTIKHFEFVIEASDPAIEQAVETKLVDLRIKHPRFTFTARFG